MKKYRDLSMIGILYVIAFFIAYLSFIHIPFSSLLAKVLLADIIATVFVFLMSTVFKNSSIYDPYWSIAPLVMVIPFITVFDVKTILVLTALYVWGIRLTLNWVYTFKGLKRQDWRYDYYKHQTKHYWPIVNFFGIHLMPTIIVFMVMIPIFLLLTVPHPYTGVTIIGFMIMIGAVCLQGIADMQMHNHRKTSPQTVYQKGLWKYSRHPNYFGEITFWFGAFIMMMSVTSNSIAVLGALINLAMFISISIPLMEKRQLKKHPEYCDYQAKTNVLVPMPNALRKQKQNA